MRTKTPRRVGLVEDWAFACLASISALHPPLGVDRLVVDEGGHPADDLQAALLEERHHLGESSSNLVYVSVGRSSNVGLVLELREVVVGELVRDVEREIVVGELPGRVEDERRGGDVPLEELLDGVTDLAAGAPDVGGDPGPERPGRRQGRAAGQAGVAAQDVGQLGAGDEVQGQARRAGRG